MAVERAGAASLRGNAFTVLGAELKPGDTAPEFSLVGAGMSTVSLKDTAGKVRLRFEPKSTRVSDLAEGEFRRGDYDGEG